MTSIRQSYDAALATLAPSARARACALSSRRDESGTWSIYDEAGRLLARVDGAKSAPKSVPGPADTYVSFDHLERFGRSLGKTIRDAVAPLEQRIRTLEDRIKMITQSITSACARIDAEAARLSRALDLEFEPVRWRVLDGRLIADCRAVGYGPTPFKFTAPISD